MEFKLSELDQLVEEGYLRRVEKDNLVLYNYTDKCTYERYWNYNTRACRGLILEKGTGKVVARPFPKFFNLGEMPETSVLVLPDISYTVSEKLDGSLGIIYYYDGHWNMATRGSFNSEQAQKGLEILHTKYDVSSSSLFQGWTYLVEIIYPENKIVVDYGKEEKLVLLGGYSPNGHELHHTDMGATLAGMSIAKQYNYTIPEMIQLQQTMPKDEEGFVVRYSNGLRVKIKGVEYCRIAKIIANLSPISFWEAMTDGIVNREYLAQVPEEFRPDYEPIVAELENQYKTTCMQIDQDAFKLPTLDVSTKEGKKIVGLFIAAPNDLRHPSAMFPYLLRNKEAMNKYVMKHIRPTGNALRIL